MEVYQHDDECAYAIFGKKTLFLTSCDKKDLEKSKKTLTQEKSTTSCSQVTFLWRVVVKLLVAPSNHDCNRTAATERI